MPTDESGKECRLDAGSPELGLLHPSKRRPLHKEALFAVAFLAAFLLLDGASTTAQTWEGAPPCQLPVALSLVLALWSGTRYVPLLLFSSILAGAINYHRPLFSWAGVPGACAIYVGYIIGALILRRRWQMDLRLNSLGDVGRFVCVSFGGAIVSTAFGVLTLLLDGLIHRSDLLHTALNWCVSDIIGIFAVGPFLLIFVAPRVSHWMHSQAASRTGDECEYRVAPHPEAI